MRGSGPRFLIAPDSFKGTFRAPEVAAAMGGGIETAGIGAIDLCPVADGGEGTMDVLTDAIGGRVLTRRVHDPLGRLIDARFAFFADRETAVIDTAEASGLALVAPQEREPERASTFGTGELVVAAIAEGAGRVLIAAGGSATTDGGLGAIDAIGRAGGRRGARLDVLCDVESPFEDAAIVFGAQKGADTEAVRRLTRRLNDQAAAFPRDPRGRPMTGCAGGLSGGLWAAFDAELHLGAPYVFRLLGLPERLRGADVVVSGEGRIDSQSFRGKVVGTLAKLCREAQTPLHVIAGASSVELRDLEALGISTLQTAATLETIRGAAARIVAHSVGVGA